MCYTVLGLSYVMLADALCIDVQKTTIVATRDILQYWISFTSGAGASTFQGYKLIICCFIYPYMIIYRYIYTPFLDTSVLS